MAILSYQPNFTGRRKPIFLTLLGIFCLCTVWVSQTPYTASLSRPFYPSEQPVSDIPSNPKPALSTTQQDASSFTDDKLDCRTAPGASDIHVVLKLGINEVYNRLPPHLLTLLSCTPSFGIYSDVAQTLHGTLIHDAIAPINASFKHVQPEFDYYRTLNALNADAQDFSAAVDKDQKGDSRLGWKLDKWKFLSSYRESYLAAPEKKWFFFIEPDTAVLWPNLLAWTRGLNPDHEIYSGSQNSHGGVTFAHGGSGVLVSRAAMHRLMGEYDVMQNEWWLNVAAGCCGDVEMARSFGDVGIALTPGFPILQGERLNTVDWNERHMCAPSVSWHHVNNRELFALWNMSMEWVENYGWDKPLLYRDLYPMYVEKHVRERRDDWDNVSADWKYTRSDDEADEEWTRLTELERKSVESFDNCRQACQAIQTCRQFKWQTGECSLGENIRVGTVRNDAKMSSGWILERVKAFGETYRDCESNWEFDQ